MRSKRPTILQIVPELDTGGAELSTVEIAGAIVAAGGRALVASEGGRLAPRIEALGGEFIPFAAATKNPLQIYLNSKRLERLIQQESIDLVHARSRAPAWSAYLATKRTGTSFMTTYHGAYGEKSALKKKYNAVMVVGAMTIANSKYTANLVQQRYGTPDNKLRVVYRGLDGTRFDPDAISNERLSALRQRWDVTPDTRIILLVARLSPIKGQTVVIEAASQLASSGKLDNTVFIFAGDAQGRHSYVNDLKTQIASAGLCDTVRLVGHVDDIPAALRLTHTALFATTKPETFGRTVIEAQAMRCPVIATNIGAPPETVLARPGDEQSNRTGWLINPGDAGALAEALTQSLNLTQGERAAMGELARDHVLTNFSLEKMRRDTLAVYDEILRCNLVDTWDDHIV